MNSRYASAAEQLLNRAYSRGCRVVERVAALLMNRSWIGMLLSGFGMLYMISGRMNAEGFVFVSMIDRPSVASAVGTHWALPRGLALLFAIEDSGSWLWKLLTWRAELPRR
jgi:hypothetical protein